MVDLGKDPRLFGLRSFRRGSTSAACRMKMPKEFVRTSGGWTSTAMRTYRSDFLPEEQASFARNLGVLASNVTQSYKKDPLQRPVQPGRVARGSNRAVNVPAALPRGYSSRCGGTGEAPFVEPEDNDVSLSYVARNPRENRLRTTADANKGRLPGWSSGLGGGRRIVRERLLESDIN